MSTKVPVSPPAAPHHEELAGLIERVTFHSDESGFCVLRVKARARRVSRVNPAVAFTAHACRFEQLDDDAFAGCQAVFDCLDSIPARVALARRCASAGVWLVHGTVAGWAGQVALCRPGDDTLARIYAGPKRGLEQRLGNLPFTVAVTANLMASRAMPLLLGRPDDALAGQVLFFNLLDNDWQTVDL